MSDQRTSNRVTVNDEYSRIDDFLSEYVTNVSRSGVFIRSRTLLPIGTHVQLKFSVLLEDFETIEGEGRVVRIVDNEREQGMGVEFTRLTDASRQILDRLEGSGGTDDPSEAEGRG